MTKKPQLYLLITILLSSLVLAQAPDMVCTVYFSGVNCDGCQDTDDLLLSDYVNSLSYISIQYETDELPENIPLLANYDSIFGTGTDEPILIFNNFTYLAGNESILQNTEALITGLVDNPCPLIDENVNFAQNDFSNAPGTPKIWADNRILINEDGYADNSLIYFLIIWPDIAEYILDFDYEIVSSEPVPLSGQSIVFEHAVMIEGWRVQWNGNPPVPPPEPEEPDEEGAGGGGGPGGAGGAGGEETSSEETSEENQEEDPTEIGDRGQPGTQDEEIAPESPEKYNQEGPLDTEKEEMPFPMIYLIVGGVIILILLILIIFLARRRKIKKILNS